MLKFHSRFIARPLNKFTHVEPFSFNLVFKFFSNGHESIQLTRFNGFKFHERYPLYRPISSQPFSASCHGNRNWRPIWKVAWWARVSCRRSRMYGIQCKLVQFALSFPTRLPFFLPEPVSCRGQRIARSNGKRNRSFTKNITTFAAVVEVLIAMFFLPFYF